MSENKVPSGIDRIVGQRLRWRRRELKLTQEQLGEKLGLTFQQVQKYEKGVNRISAGRLFEMAQVLGITITYFYEGVDDLLEEPGVLSVHEDDHPPSLPVLDGEAMELIKAFQQIGDKSLRRSLLDTIRAAAASNETGTAA
ncbi:MAG: helix-turn-helix domain-containing protein [Henriciella sp.]|jgi:transcriptional regulator with XRE-family HTH domain|mmetsp:Transcript_16782/g.21662  ORF Transcript_16782/g.21662 Transcript_16782/m.21662 type:complete len:141 (+) Transcript_16782:39-461(+)